MKILMLTLEFAPQMFGGLGSQVIGLCKELRNQGHSVDVVLLMADIYVGNSQWTNQPREYDGINIYPVQLPVYSDVYWLDQISSNTFILSYMTRNLPKTYDVVHCHSWIPYAAAHEFCRINDLPLVATFHRIQAFRDAASKASLENTFVMGMDKWICDTAMQIICVSNALVEQVDAISKRHDNVSFIPCGIDANDFRVARKKNLSEYYDILFIGRLATEKGLPTLLRTIASMNDHGIRLTIAGEGPERHVVESYNDTVNLRMLGKLSRDQVSYAYEEADLVVVPSYMEPFGVVVIEALASGKPVIVSAVGGMVEILKGHEEFGTLVPPQNVDKLADAISVWKNKVPLESVSLERHEYIEQKYSWPIIVKEHTLVYEKAIYGSKG